MQHRIKLALPDLAHRIGKIIEERQHKGAPIEIERIDLAREVIEEAGAKVIVFVPLTGALRMLAAGSRMSRMCRFRVVCESAASGKNVALGSFQIAGEKVTGCRRMSAPSGSACQGACQLSQSSGVSSRQVWPVASASARANTVVPDF